MLEEKSKFHFYSYGVVAVNKDLDSDIVEITPVEYTPMLDGEITDNNVQYLGKGKDAMGRSFDEQVDTTASVRAKWLPWFDTNRKTSPDVRRGESVCLFRFGDTDQYWWTTFLQAKHIRRLETVIWSFSNNREENKEDDADSTYWMEVSTHGKYIHLQTAKNDGEPFVYYIQINTKEGCITIKDDDENIIFLDSQERHIKLKNKDNSFVSINKRKIHINALDEVKITTKDYINESSNSITESTQTYKVTSTSYAHVTTTWKVDAPTSEFTGANKSGPHTATTYSGPHV